MQSAEFLWPVISKVLVADESWPRDRKSGSRFVHISLLDNLNTSRHWLPSRLSILGLCCLSMAFRNLGGVVVARG
jgi:hypothetical protein